MGSHRVYHLPPSYLMAKNRKRQFQLEMESFALEDERKICLLDAPTGAGKTFGFRLMSKKEGFLLIVLPNNLLALEVYDSFKNENEVSLLIGSEINKKMDEKKKAGFVNVTKRKVIDEIIGDHNIIITNPTVFYYIILNKYFYKFDPDGKPSKVMKKGDHLSSLISQGLSMIIFDEFHVYSRDQRYILFATVTSFREDIKIMFSSATLPPDLEEICRELYGNQNIRIIKAERKYDSIEGTELIQGPIDLDIVSGCSTEDFIENNSNLFSQGKWFIIADSIRNIDEISEKIKAKFSDEEITRVSAFHDPSYLNYKTLKIPSSGKRFVVGSNIIEQGINPPPDYFNFIIEPGQEIENLMQRIGRVGRGVKIKSKVYVIIKNEIQQFSDINNIGEFYSFIQNFYMSRSNTKLIKRFIGPYIGAILQNFSPGLKEDVIGNLKAKEETIGILPYIYAYMNVSQKFSDQNSKWLKIVQKTLRQIEEIKEWWRDYSKTLESFIPDQRKVEVFEIGSDESPKDFRTKYNEIWLFKNKNINRYGNVFIIGEYLKKPTYNFLVRVKGIPFFKENEYEYGEVAPYKARAIIKKGFESWYQIYSYNISLSDDLIGLFDDIKKIIDSTADYERLTVVPVD